MDRAVDFVKVKSKVTMDEFKKGLEFQKFLNVYVVGSFNMAYNDMKCYLAAKCHFIDKSFVDIVQKTFNEGGELDFTTAQLVLTDPGQPILTDPISSVLFVELPFDMAFIIEL